MQERRFMNGPMKAKDLSKWSTWYSVARDLALNYGIRRVPEKTWRAMFDEGLTPQEAVRKHSS
jgi:hypothetical protein